MSATLERDTQTAAPSARLLDQLEIARRGFRVYLAGMSLGATALTLGLVGTTLLVLDWWFILPFAIRAIGLGLLLTAGLIALVRPVRRLLRLRHGDAATAIERAFPEIGQRLTTSLDYVEPTPATVPAKASLVSALVVDTDERTARLDLDHLVPWGRLVGIAAMLLVGAVTLMIALAASRELRIAAQRMFLVPAHYTALELNPGNAKLKAGEDLKIDVAVTGRPLRTLDLRYRTPGSQQWTTLALGTPPAPVEEGAPQPEPEPIAGTVTTTLRDRQADLEYQVVSGEIVSPTYRLQVIHPLVLKEAMAQITPPAYTKRKPSTQPQGSLRVIEGSRVRLEFAFDRAPERVNVELTRKLPEKTQTELLPLELAAEVAAITWNSVDADAEYRLVAESADGLKLESPSYRLRVQRDEKPTVKFIDPPEQMEATPTTEVPLIVKSTDDFGVAKVGIVLQIADGARETFYTEDFPDAQPTAEAIARLFLEKHDVRFPDAITYHAFVEDNKPGKSQRAVTDLRFIDIRPYQRDYQMVGGGSGSCCGNSVSLEELIARQRLNLNRSFAQLDRPKVDEEALKRLVKNQEELHAATKEISDALAAKFEAVPALEDAVEAMSGAVEQLKAKTMPPAVASEEQAVAHLVRARQNLRKLLKEQSQSQCEACRKFDQAQAQKLRPPTKKKEEEQTQLGDDVEKLAKKQKKFSEELAQKQSVQMEQKSQSKSSSQSSSQSSSSQSEPKEEEPETLQKRQENAAAQAEELQKRVAEDESLTDLAKERMEASAKSIQESADALKSGDEKAAEDAAKEAADTLEQLAQQIAGLKTPDLSARVGKARDLAQELAEKQGALSRRMQSGKSQSGESSSEESGEGSSSSESGSQGQPKPGEQRKLAESAKTLSDLLARLNAESSDQDRELARAVAQAVDRHQPDQTAEQMSQAADKLQQGDTPGAARDANEAAKDLADLARDLDAAHRGLVRELLDQLLAVEKQAAKTEESLTSAKTPGDKATAQTELNDLQQSLERLPQPGQSVSEAAGELAAVAGEAWTADRDPRGNYVVPQPALNGLKRTIQALQARIQELILKDAVLDRDAPVPPEYQKLVEEYYKALSEDLR